MTAKNRIYIFGYAAALALAVGLISVFSNASAQVPPTAPAGSNIDQRIAQRKAERKIALDQNNTQRLQNTCVNTQTKIREVRDNVVKVSNKRSEVYRKVDAKLWVAIGSLKYVNKDTFKLEQERGELLKQVMSFESMVKEYRTVLDDMANMNCKADVVGFKALLETARIYNAEIRKQSVAIKIQVINKVKPVLATHANELKPNTSAQ